MQKPPRPRNRPRKRGGKRSNNNSSNGKHTSQTQPSPKTPQSPPPPQLKISLRHVGNVGTYGTVAGMMQLVRALVQQVNQARTNAAVHTNTTTSSTSVSSSNGVQLLPLQLGQESVQTLIEAERLVMERQTAETPVAETPDSSDTAHDDGAAVDEASPTTTTTITTSPQAPDYANVLVKGESDDTTTVPAAGPVIHVRVLYAVPAKKSRRRGVNTGCVYLVLSTDPRTPATTTTTTPSPSPQVLTPAETSRMMARGRLQLAHALEALSDIAQLDAKSTDPQFAGCRVESSRNVKTWKPKTRFDNRVGTIEATDDYKRFQQDLVQQQEERLARPKPTPGGGATDNATIASLATTTASSDNGQNLSALVLHVRAKRERDGRRNKRLIGRAAAPKQKKGSGGGDGGKESGKPKQSGKPTSRRGGDKKTNKSKGNGGSCSNNNKKNSESSSSKTPKRANLTLLDKAGMKAT